MPSSASAERSTRTPSLPRSSAPTTTTAPTPLNLGWRHRLSAFAVLALVASLAARRRDPAAAATLALLALNADFYRLLLRRRGPRSAAAGVGLHALHHLTGAAAIPVALWRLRRRRIGFPAPDPR